MQKLINSAGHPELPIVVPDVFTYVPLGHYSSAGLKSRLTLLPPPLESGNWDTTNKGMALLQYYWPVRVQEASEFLNLSNPFLVYLDE